MLKKTILILFFVSLLILLFVACIIGIALNAPPAASPKEQSSEHFQDLVSSFEASHPGIKIKSEIVEGETEYWHKIRFRDPVKIYLEFQNSYGKEWVWIEVQYDQIGLNAAIEIQKKWIDEYSQKTFSEAELQDEYGWLQEGLSGRNSLDFWGNYVITMDNSNQYNQNITFVGLLKQ